ncbi:MAG: EI24 domain-containing protein [bacterium]|nr:EI24 domain-containing protein [bacterium]
MGFVARVHAGMRLASEGFSFLRGQPRLWGLATVPVLFALLCVGGAGSAFWLHLDEIHAFFASLLPELEAGAWWTWLWVGPGKALLFLARWLAVLLSFAVTFVAALLVANVASAPFLDVLSERVEAIALGRGVASEEGLLAGALSSFVSELGRVAFLGGIWVLLTGAGLVVPGAHFVTGPLLIAITIAFLPLDYAGFALDRRGLSFADRRRWLAAHRPTMLGFGGIAFAACMVPGLNLVLLPTLVTAGTLLVARTNPTRDEAAALGVDAG